MSTTQWSTPNNIQGKVIHRRMPPPKEVAIAVSGLLAMPADQYTQDHVLFLHHLVRGQKDFNLEDSGVKDASSFPGVAEQMKILLKRFANVGLTWTAGKQTMFDPIPVVGVRFETVTQLTEFGEFVEKSSDPQVVTKFLEKVKEFKR